MKKTKLLSLVLCVVLILSSFSLTAMAISFDDVDNDATVEWAKDSIHKMTDAGYIKGYEDGTFRPARPITKIECLILMSRMLGFENKNFGDIAKKASKEYNSLTSKYNATYADEISYLLYCGVLTESDLADYASAANANTQLLRYQAAMLMAKLLGADAEAKAYTVSTPTYADNISIPTNAKPYVEYVTKEGIMNGMDAAEDGTPQFFPVVSLTRAQVATLLARLMDKLSVEYVTGTVEAISKNSITVGKDKMGITKSTVVYADGDEISLDDIEVGAEVAVVKACKNAFVISLSKPVEENPTIIYGVVAHKSENASGQTLTIADYEDDSITETYTLKANCKITVGSSKGVFGDIMKDDFLKLELSGGKIAAISTEKSKIDIDGKLVSVEYDDDDNVYLNVGDKDGKNVQKYVVSSKSCAVVRDEEDVEFRDLSAGDTVSLRLTYGKVTRVSAVSSTEKITGLLTEIIISSNPAVTITKDGKSNTYKLRSDAKITVEDKKADIYALRPNITVSVTLDSNQVKSLSASKVAVSEDGEMVGTLISKNTNYKVLTIEDENGNTQSVYYNSKTTFMTRSGNTTTVKSLEEGAEVSIVGATKNGVFEATIVIFK